MESSDRIEGDRGVFTEKISSIFCSEGLAKEGDETGLCGGEVLTRGPEPTRGGKLESEKIEVGSEKEEGTDSRKCGGEG